MSPKLALSILALACATAGCGSSEARTAPDAGPNALGGSTGEVDSLLSLPFDAHVDGSQGDRARAYAIQRSVEQAMEEARHPLQWGPLLDASWPLTKDQSPPTYARLVAEWQWVRPH